MREREGEGGRMRERERDRGEERGGQRRGRSPLDPESANSNITIRPPGSERRRTLRLPPSSYVLSLSLSLFCVSLSLFLSLLGISFFPTTVHSFRAISVPSPCFRPDSTTQHQPTSSSSSSPPPFLHGRTSVLTSANSRGGRLAAQTPPTNAFSLGADEMADEKTRSPPFANSAARKRDAKAEDQRRRRRPGPTATRGFRPTEEAFFLFVLFIELLSIILGLSRKEKKEICSRERDF